MNEVKTKMESLLTTRELERKVFELKVENDFLKNKIDYLELMLSEKKNN